MFVNFTALLAFAKRTWRSLLLFTSCASALFVFGAVRLLDRTESPKLAALLVQPALLPHEKEFISERRDEMVPVLEQWRRMLSLIEQAKGPVDLLVFPEGSLPFAAHRTIYPMSLVERVWQEFFHELPPPPDLHSARIHLKTKEVYVSNAYWMQALADKFQCEVIAGLDDKDEEGKQYNAAFHFKPHAAKSARYEKRILVPIAEYIPCSRWAWVRAFIWEQYGISESFVPGTEAKLFDGRVPIGISICYEETFSSLVRELKTKGAKLFVNLTNDGWYPHSKLAQQHFDHALLRAVENGVPSLRACCTGVTGGVDCFGRVIAVAPEDEPVALELSLPLQTTSTLYATLGDAAIVVLSALFAITLFIKKNSCPK
jgi:apolipoprotein N-acyltransferase